MSDLITFLKARLDEDERESQPNPEHPYVGGWHKSGCVTYCYDPVECDCGLPARVLADVAAKRQLIARVAEDGMMAWDPRKAQAASTQEWYLIAACRDTLKLLALPYADHPDYRQEWKP